MNPLYSFDLLFGSQTVDPVYAGHGFTVEATDGLGNIVPVFPTSVEVIVSYDDRDWHDQGLAERSLRLFTWTGAGWIAEWPCDGCQLDPVKNQLVSYVSHIGEFALAGLRDFDEKLLPLILSGGEVGHQARRLPLLQARMDG
jgi:hypothetical protein